MYRSSYTFSSPEARRAATAAVNAAVQHDDCTRLLNDIALLRIHLAAAQSPEIYQRARVRIAALEREHEALIKSQAANKVSA